LGTGNNKDALLPTLVDVPVKQDKTGKLVRIAAGYHHSMVLTDAGRIYSWGTGDVGQLGHGPTLKRTMSPTLISVASEERFVAISASEHHSVALTDEGRVFSWGHNRWKQLGHDLSSPDKTHTPQAVPTSVTFSRITAGSAHTLAISKDQNQLYYWGRLVLVSECISSPKLLDTCASVSFCDISSRVNHCLALTKTGELWAFGYNEFGQCGVGTFSPVFQPTMSPVQNGLKFSSIVAGGNHSLALAKHESLQNSYRNDSVPSSPSSSSEDLKKSSSEDLRKNMIRVELGDAKRTATTSSASSSSQESNTSPTSPRGRATRISITKPISVIIEQLATLTKREQDLKAERDALRAQQKALDEAFADWTRRDDELAAERTRALKEAGLL
jgi:hypothetical protein